MYILWSNNQRHIYPEVYSPSSTCSAYIHCQCYMMMAASTLSSWVQLNRINIELISFFRFRVSHTYPSCSCCCCCCCFSCSSTYTHTSHFTRTHLHTDTHIQTPFQTSMFWHRIRAPATRANSTEHHIDQTHGIR